MLEELRIRGLGVIEESVLDLAPGFTALTGETGAGKTMVVTALALLRGGRADPGVVRRGASSARVEGVVHLAPEELTDLSGRLEAVGELDDGRLLLGRQVTGDAGRSRAFAGGAVVPAGALAGLLDPLVAVHGQSDQHRLLRLAAQRDALDRFAGAEATALRQQFAADLTLLRHVEEEAAAVTASVRERAREADLLRFGLGEIERVDPQPGEEVELAVEERRLGYADELRVAASLAREALSSESLGDAVDALGAVGTARRALEQVRDHDPAAAVLADRLAELGYLLADLAADVASYADDVDADPLRLAAVSQRRAQLLALTRKYGESSDDVLAWAAAASRRLLDLDSTDERIAGLRTRAEQLRQRLAVTGAALSRVRAEAAGRLGVAVSAELHALAMPDASVEVALSQRDCAAEDPAGLVVDVGSGPRRLRCSATGLDDVELLLTADRGTSARPLARGASGGELSRVMLALEVTLAATGSVRTFVFDEVDAGVGGAAAVEVGRRLSRLARHAQVLVVTHLPQVAAFADHHVVVRKSSAGAVTASDLTTLDGPARVTELSRMLAGLEDSSTARAHAEELLATARTPAAASGEPSAGRVTMRRP